MFCCYINFVWLRVVLVFLLVVFEMAIVRKILGCSRRDHRRNTDMMKDLAIDKDIG